MLAEYPTYKDEPIQKLYVKIVSLNIDIPVIAIRKKPTQIEIFYKSKKYSELALLIQNQENHGSTEQFIKQKEMNLKMYWLMFFQISKNILKRETRFPFES